MITLIYMESDLERERIACLRSTRSPFVLEGLKSPVKWWGWCDEAFRYARETDRPVLLDIGAIWCWWCHVMDETTYSDPEVAQHINANFVPIKVDRDERPDVDRRFQEAAYLVSRQSGWPLTVFMTPDGDVIWAATYLPPRDSGGMPGMLSVLRAVLDAYRNRRGQIKEYGMELRRALEHGYRAAPGEPSRYDVVFLITSLLDRFDERWGGFGTAPKFPPTAELTLLMYRAYYDSKKSLYDRVVTVTLNGMARGGIYDQLEGGFFRYSTDAMWVVPHYEKLLVDNAELTRIYAEAYALYGDPEYRRVVEGNVRWLDRHMRDPRGGYYASQSAVWGDEEGGYYRWTLEELREALGDGELLNMALEHFGYYAYDWPEGKATLFVAVDRNGLARKYSDVDAKLGEIYRRLLERRAAREPPFTDKTIYSGWSCSMALAELYAHRYVGVGDRDHALATLDRVIRELWDGEVLWHGLRDGEKVSRGVLEDYAYCILALLEGLAETGREAYLSAALAMGRALLDRFASPEGGFHDVDVPGGPGLAEVRVRPITDAPHMSPNALAVIAVDRLFYVTGRREFREAADRAVRGLYGLASRLGTAGYYLALEHHLVEPPRIVVVGGPESELYGAALRVYRPLKIVVPLTDGVLGYVEDSAVRAMRGQRGAAFVCAADACSMPIRDPDQLTGTVRDFRRESYALHFE